MGPRTITHNTEFLRCYNKGKSYVSPDLVLYVLKTRRKYVRVGLTATKKIGHAVVRSRARRVMRVALRENLLPDMKGYDLVLVARARTPKLKSGQVSAALARLMDRAGLPRLHPEHPAPPLPVIEPETERLIAAAVAAETPEGSGEAPESTAAPEAGTAQ